jgi:hypothetical protein
MISYFNSLLDNLKKIKKYELEMEVKRQGKVTLRI